MQKLSRYFRKIYKNDKKSQFLFYVTATIFTMLIIITLYRISVLNRKQTQSKNDESIETKIERLVPLVAKSYQNFESKDDLRIETFIYNLKTISKTYNSENLWKLVKLWPSKDQLYDATSKALGNLVKALKDTKIIKADIDTRGTQLKLLLTLEGDQKVVFKPKWYPIEKVIRGPVYSGKDRYGSEIVGFYLSALFKMPLTSIVTERKISLKNEILPVATDRLNDTIFQRNSNWCVCGKCFYCKKEDPVCEDETKVITGAVILNIDANFKKYRSPWQRTYKTGKRAPWEVNNDFCKFVKTELPEKRLLDLVDVAIFDFMLQNGDRHHYETLEDKVVLIDNGKGLGNPHIHFIDILAPLYQCCILRHSTKKTLEGLGGGILTEKLREMPEIDKILTEDHFKALEERLLIIYATVEYCKTTNNKIEHDIF